MGVVVAKNRGQPQNGGRVTKKTKKKVTIVGREGGRARQKMDAEGAYVEREREGEEETRRGKIKNKKRGDKKEELLLELCLSLLDLAGAVHILERFRPRWILDPEKKIMELLARKPLPNRTKALKANPRSFLKNLRVGH